MVDSDRSGVGTWCHVIQSGLFLSFLSFVSFQPFISYLSFLSIVSNLSLLVELEQLGPVFFVQICSLL